MWYSVVVGICGRRIYKAYVNWILFQVIQLIELTIKEVVVGAPSGVAFTKGSIDIRLNATGLEYITQLTGYFKMEQLSKYRSSIFVIQT